MREREVSRFDRPPDPRFWAMNRSLAVDGWLAEYDIRQSRAHIRALRKLDVLDDAELETLDSGLEEVGRELAENRFSFEESDEDIHMAIERRLGEIVGTVAGRLHTARSRNDQVATDLALAVMDHAERARILIVELMGRILELARAHRDWPMPGYTHLQRAQPVYLGHHLMSWFWMLSRDAARFEQARRAASVMPAGSGALAGLNWNLDRLALAEDLGFAEVSSNSLDGVANRDFALDYLSAASICAMHLSRIGSEIVIWSSAEFGFCQLDESFTSGSSIMPQKQNPDSAEILRSKSPGLAQSFAGLAGVMHALPLTYNKDLQEDKRPVADGIAAIEGSLHLAIGMLEGIEFDRETLSEASADEMLAATEIADLLVRKGMPFRDAHGIVGDLVRQCVDEGRSLSDLDREELAKRSDLLDDEFFEILGQSSWLESKVSPGGTSLASFDTQIEAAEAAMAATSD
jgi:argininosuccinate lyase